MLVLTRKVGEKIRIGDGVTLEVTEIKGKQVRLRFDAPKDVSILREEIADEPKPKRRLVSCD